ncbi:hypothetical protein L5515_009616 [Caenorhabditis briggsae]|uniref:DUF38 domain-containing protein n=1 Tax=Caenorhabditis briggsae TaxID=6238 RepID=A0AAE9FAC2_CAEBR|nr:hypothetical protein L5515_009616 [Caenorhabditis briggsae]
MSNPLGVLLANLISTIIVKSPDDVIWLNVFTCVPSVFVMLIATMVHFSKFIKFPNQFFNELEDLAIYFARRKARFHCLYGSERLDIDFKQFGEDTAMDFVRLMYLDDGITVDVIRLLSLEMWKTENFDGEGIRLWIKVEEITLEMLENIRKVFISSPFFSIRLHCKNHFEKSIFPETFGGFQPLSNPSRVKKSEVWPIPNGKNRFFGYRFDGNDVFFTSFSFEKIAEKAGVSDDLLQDIWKLSIKPIDNILSLKVFENNLIMEILLKHLALFEIQILRKVSAGIRKCVDTVKPDTYIHNIGISFDDFGSIGYDIQLSAQYHFQTDRMVSTRQEELKIILEFIFPKILFFNFAHDTSKVEENGTIRPIDFSEDRKFLELNEISKMKAWMDSEEIYCATYRIITEIQNFEIAHLKKGEILVENVSSEDVAYLKEKFLQNQRLEKFQIFFKNCQINGEIYNLLGSPFKITEHFSICVVHRHEIIKTFGAKVIPLDKLDIVNQPTGKTPYHTMNYEYHEVKMLEQNYCWILKYPDSKPKK